MPVGMTDPTEPGETGLQNNGGMTKPNQRVSSALPVDLRWHCRQWLRRITWPLPKPGTIRSQRDFLFNSRLM